MASTHKSLRSSTANKRPTTAIADGQIALNTNATSPGLFFKDSTGATIIKIGPVHVGTTAPNATPGSGGSTGNSTGEVWLDTSLTPVGVKIWDGTAWANATPSGSTTVQGLLELATNAETQTGSDTARAVTPAGLQSKLSDSATTTSSTTIASSTAVKAAYDLAAAAVPLTGGTVTGNLEIGTTGSLSFEGATANGFETTIAVVDPTADRTITLPDITGTVVLDQGAQTVQFGLGAAATPSVTFTGDPNTGIYSPGADQLAISTGGTGRLFIDSFGRLLVGQTTTGLQAARSFSWQGSGEGTFYISHSTSDGNGDPFVKFGYNAGQIGSIIQAGNTGIGIYSNDYFTLGSNNTERVRIDSSGRVGIGTSSPGTTLDVAITGGMLRTGGAFGNNLIQAYTGSVGLGMWAGGTTRFYSTGNITLSTNATIGTDFPTGHVDAMTIDSSGRVGIGTTSPGYALDVVGTVNSNALFRASNGTHIALLGSEAFSAGVVGVGSGSNHPLVFGTNSTERARIDSSGRLLVGASSYDGNARAIVQGNTSSNTTGALSIRYNGARPSAADVGIGAIRFESTSQTSSNYHYASINCDTDGASTSDTDIPGRLVFSTTADGASTPTTRFTLNRVGDAVFSNTSAVYPATDNAATIGGSSNRWSAVWAANGTIQTSDQRAKTEITAAKLGSDFIRSLRPVSYKWIDGGQIDSGRRDEDNNYIYESVPGSRVHWGFIAQEVKEAVDAAGVDFGGWVLTDKDDPDSQQALRYDQFIAPLTKALQEALVEIDVLKAKVAALEGV